MQQQAPVITIDGPSGSGKGTISHLLAQQLGWHYLDSGSLYRVLALAAQNKKIMLDDGPKLAHLAQNLNVQFKIQTATEITLQILLDQIDVTQSIRTEACSAAASKIAALPEVRRALLERQRAFRLMPGLVTDGRDMGTVVFPDASIKIFLTASLEERAQRRYNQLMQKGIHANLAAILEDMRERDKRDRERSVAPLKAADDAEIIDTTNMSIEEVVTQIMDVVRECEDIL